MKFAIVLCLSVLCFSTFAQVSQKTIPEIASKRYVKHYYQNRILSLVVHMDQSLDERSQIAILSRIGAKAELELKGKKHTYRIQIHERNIDQLLNNPNIKFVEPVNAPDLPLNHQNRALQHVNFDQHRFFLNSHGGYGDGVTVGIGDGGELGDHIDFGQRVINYANGTYNSFGNHGDHVAGIVAGAGWINPFHRGMAGKSELVIQKTSQIIYNTEDYFNAHNMTLTNNSYGTTFNCTTNGSYNYSSQNLDWLSNHLDQVLHVFAAGNSGGGHCAPYPQGYKTVLRYYQSAKNVLTVGNIDQNLNIASSSSRGPVKDGRLKPEIMGIGKNVISTGRNYNYISKSGTSMAAPSVTGSLALISERYKEVNFGKNIPGALLKAIAMNTARDMGRPGPDFMYGYGLMNTKKAINAVELQRHFEGVIQEGDHLNYMIDIPGNVKQVKVMLYWHDKEAAVYPDKALVNDLDLKAYNVNGDELLPLVLDHTASGVENDAVPGEDHLNNSEQIVYDVSNNVAGNLTINVHGHDIPENAGQIFYVTYEYIYDIVTLTHPNRKQRFVPGIKELITWEADNDNTEAFKIQVSYNNGYTWDTIAENIDASSRSYEWDVPNIPTSVAKMRVSKMDSGSDDYTNGKFTIHARPQNFTATEYCEYIKLNWDYQFYSGLGLLSFDVFVFNGNEMQFLGNTTNQYFKVTGLEQNQEYWFSVRTKFQAEDNLIKSKRVNAIRASLDCTNEAPDIIQDNDVKHKILY